MASSPIPSKCATTGCGPGKKTCTTRALNTKTGKYEDVIATIELYDDDCIDNYDVISKNYADVDTTTNLSNAPVMPIDYDDALLRNERNNELRNPKSKDYSDGYTTTHAADYRTFSDSQFEGFDDKPSTSASSKRPNDKIDREISATSVSSRFDKIDSNNSDRKAPYAYNRFGRVQATRSNDGGELYTFDQFGRPVRTSTGAYDEKIPYTFDPFGKSGSKPISTNDGIRSTARDAVETTSTGTCNENEPDTSDRFGNSERISAGGYCDGRGPTFDTYIKPETTCTGTNHDREPNISGRFSNVERIPTRAYSGKGPITFDTYVKPETSSTGTYYDGKELKAFDTFSSPDGKQSITFDPLLPDASQTTAYDRKAPNSDRFGNAERIPNSTSHSKGLNDIFGIPVATATGTHDRREQNTNDRFSMLTAPTNAYDDRGPNRDRFGRPDTTQKSNINSRTQKLDKLEELTESRRKNDIPFEREVREWIQELPMFPTSGKQAKEDSTNTINNLINNLNYLTPRADDPDYEEKIKIAICKCLRKMPIWYPGDKRDQDEFENTLIEKLFEKITKKSSKIVDGANADIATLVTITASNSAVNCKPEAQHNSNATSNKPVSSSTVTNKPIAPQNSTTASIKTDSNLTVSSNTAAKQNLNTISNRRASNSKVPNDEIRNAIMGWLVAVNPRRSKDGNSMTNYMPQIADYVNERLRPLLTNPVRTKNRKLVLKSALLKILGELPMNVNCPKSRILYLQNFSEDLANRVYMIQAKYAKQNNTSVATALTSRFVYSDCTQRESMIWHSVRECFEDCNIECHHTVIEDVGYILMEFIEMPDPEGEIDAINALIHLLVTSTKLSDDQASITAKMLIRNVKNYMNEGTIYSNVHSSKSLQRNTISVYSSAELSPSYPLTSTPKRKSEKKKIPKLNLQENTMQIFISKYLDHNYDIDDSLARRALNRLLVTHLQRLDLSKRNEVYDNFDNSTNNDEFIPEKFIGELEYIKYVSDWLKNLPLEPHFNTPGNHERIDVVNSLAISIQEIEEERRNDPSAMNYDLYIGSIILQTLRELPILKEYCSDRHVNVMIDQLVDKITANRQTVAELVEANESLHTTGVHIDNIGDFIEEFIIINGDDIAHDEVKLEAWAVRLIRQIKHIIRNNKDASVIPNAEVYDELLGVPITGDENAKRFSLELEYVTEISNWLKNLPLLPISKFDEDDRVKAICELAEKITEMESRSVINPKDTRVNADFEEYVAKWILDLPLDKQQDIVLPILIKQLSNRMERVRHKVSPGMEVSQSNKSMEKVPNKDMRKQDLTPRKGSKDTLNASKIIIDEIEKIWSNALPINNIKEAVKIRNDVSKMLIQKVAQLNMDTKVFNNDAVYKDKLEEEIDKLLENISETVGLKMENKGKLKTNLVNAIMGARNDMKEDTTENNNNTPQNRKSLQGDDDKIEVLEDSGFENEEDEIVEERECPIERLRRYKGIPYCIVPMRYICKKCDGYNMFWCKMPVSGYF